MTGPIPGTLWSNSGDDRGQVFNLAVLVLSMFLSAAKNAVTGNRAALRLYSYRFDSESVRSGGCTLTIVGGNEQVRRPFRGAGHM